MMRLKTILPDNRYDADKQGSKIKKTITLPDLDPFKANVFNILKLSPRWNSNSVIGTNSNFHLPQIHNSCAIIV